jgi:hypothetical protein
MRLVPMDNIAPVLLDFSSSHDTRKLNLGSIIHASGTDYDTTANVANWGQAELIYVAYTGSAALLPGSAVTVDKNFRISLTAAQASMVNTAQPVGFALTNFSAGNVTEQYGWMLRRGVCPAAFSVAATAGAVYCGAAGNLTPTAANGAQLHAARTIIAAAATFTRTGRTKSGSARVEFSHVTGMFPGQAISGTGIPSSSVISSIDTDGRSVWIGSAIGTLVNATATGSVTCTMTNTGYGIVAVAYPSVQTQAA